MQTEFDFYFRKKPGNNFASSSTSARNRKRPKSISFDLKSINPSLNLLQDDGKGPDSSNVISAGATLAEDQGIPFDNLQESIPKNVRGSIWDGIDQIMPQINEETPSTYETESENYQDRVQPDINNDHINTPINEDHPSSYQAESGNYQDSIQPDINERCLHAPQDQQACDQGRQNKDINTNISGKEKDRTNLEKGNYVDSVPSREREEA